MTDVVHWDDPPAQFRLDGPFTAGTQGATETPGQPTRQWILQDVQHGQSYSVEFPLDGAILFFVWQFSGISGGRTLLTQRITLQGENTSAYLSDVRAVFTSGLAPGMKRIAAVIDEAFAVSQRKDDGERVRR